MARVSWDYCSVQTRAPTQMVQGCLEEVRRIKCLIREKQRSCTLRLCTKSYLFSCLHPQASVGLHPLCVLAHTNWKYQWRRMLFVFSCCFSSSIHYLLLLICFAVGTWEKILLNVIGWCGVALQASDAVVAWCAPFVFFLMLLKRSDCSDCTY